MVEMGKQLVEIDTNFNQLENLGAKFKHFQRRQSQNQLSESTELRPRLHFQIVGVLSTRSNSTRWLWLDQRQTRANYATPANY